MCILYLTNQIKSNQIKSKKYLHKTQYLNIFLTIF